MLCLITLLFEMKCIPFRRMCPRCEGSDPKLRVWRYQKNKNQVVLKARYLFCEQPPVPLCLTGEPKISTRHLRCVVGSKRDLCCVQEDDLKLRV